jgi:hypothetical protein
VRAPFRLTSLDQAAVVLELEIFCLFEHTRSLARAEPDRERT